MGVATLVEFLVGVAHGFRLSAAEHHLEVDRLEAVVLEAYRHQQTSENGNGNGSAH